MAPSISRIVYSNITESLTFLHHFHKYGGDWARPQVRYGVLEDFSAHPRPMQFRPDAMRHNISDTPVPAWEDLKKCDTAAKVMAAKPPNIDDEDADSLTCRAMMPLPPFVASPLWNAAASRPAERVPDMLSAIAMFDTAHVGDANAPSAEEHCKQIV